MRQHWHYDPFHGQLAAAEDASGAPSEPGRHARRHTSNLLGLGARFVNTTDQPILLTGLTPSNTRTATSATGLVNQFANEGGIAELALGRLMAPKRVVRQYQVSQDHMRRPEAAGLSARREAGDAPGWHTPRIESRTITIQGYGLRAKATGADIREADEGLDINEINASQIRSRLRLEMEYGFVDFVTSTGNFAAGHTGASVARWDAAGGLPLTDVLTGKGVVQSDCGTLSGGEWVLCMGWDSWSALLRNADITTRWSTWIGNARAAGTPDPEFIANTLGVSRILVSQMAAGPTQATTTLPVVTDNTYVWAAANDTAFLCYVNEGVRMTGRVLPGQFSGALMVSQYGPWQNRYFGGDAVAGPEGQVEVVAEFDDFTFTAGAYNDATNQDMVASYLITNTLA